jgi:protease PrsW
MIIFFSAMAAVVPMLVYLSLIWRFDRYDREPIVLILTNYLWGAIGAIVLTVVLGGILNLLISAIAIGENVQDFLSTSLSAPIVEEMTKGFFLLLMVQNKNFDNITDGLVIVVLLVLALV